MVGKESPNGRDDAVAVISAKDTEAPCALQVNGVLGEVAFLRLEDILSKFNKGGKILCDGLKTQRVRFFSERHFRKDSLKFRKIRYPEPKNESIVSPIVLKQGLRYPQKAIRKDKVKEGGLAFK